MGGFVLRLLYAQYGVGGDIQQIDSIAQFVGGDTIKDDPLAEFVRLDTSDDGDSVLFGEHGDEGGSGSRVESAIRV